MLVQEDVAPPLVNLDLWLRVIPAIHNRHQLLIEALDAVFMHAAIHEAHHLAARCVQPLKIAQESVALRRLEDVPVVVREGNLWT